MKPRLLRIKSIPEQYIEDVFNEFYRLDSIISDGNEYQRNYVVTRLVTIIEQFFRIIVEDKLYDRNGKAPEPVNLDPDIIDKIASIHFKGEREITRELVMSLNYKFQSGDQIKKTMKDYGMRVFRDGVEKRPTMMSYLSCGTRYRSTRLSSRRQRSGNTTNRQRSCSSTSWGWPT